MGKHDAEVTIGADASAVTRAMAAAKSAVGSFAETMAVSIGAASLAVVRDLASVVTAQGKISFSSQHRQVRDFEKATASLAVATGTSMSAMRSHYESTGIAIGKLPAEVAAWSTEVGKLTYHFDTTGQSMRAVAELAAETGRTTDDYHGLTVEIGLIPGVAGDASHAIGTLVAQSKTLGNAGGVAAFADQMQGLADVMTKFELRGKGGFAKVSGLAAELGKGLGAPEASRVQKTLFNDVAGDAINWSRWLGHDITNKKTGRIEDPVKVLEEIQARAKRLYGSHARRALMVRFGAEAGSVLYNTDFKEAERLAHVKPSQDAAKALEEKNKTDAGKRDVAAANLAVSSRNLMGSATLLGKAADALQQFAAKHPIASTGATDVVEGVGVVGALKVGGKYLAKKIGIGGAAKAATAAAGESAAGAGLATAVGAASAAAIAGTVIAGLAVGGGVGYFLDSQFHISDKLATAGEGGTRRAADAAEDAANGARTKKLKQLDAAVGYDVSPADKAKALDAVFRVASARPEALSGGTPLVAALAAELKKLHESDKQADKIAKAIAQAFSRMQVQIVNASDTPVNANMSYGSSPSGGQQGR